MWPKREACVGVVRGWEKGVCVHPSRPPSARPRPAGPGWGRCRWRELGGKLSGSRWGRGGAGRACGGGRKGEGRCHTPLFSLESGSGGGRPKKNAFLWGPKRSRLGKRAQKLNHLKNPSVCGRHQSHGQRPTAMAETRADSQHRAIFFFSHFDRFREKQKARTVLHL